jgi:FkbM family methyltransferase
MRSLRLREFIKSLPIAGPAAHSLWSAIRPLRLWIHARTARACYIGDGVVLAQVQGFKMYLPTEDAGITPHLILEGFWEAWAANCFLRALRPGMTVVDVGANVGYYTLLASRAVGPTGRVYAFEPEPRNFGLLRRTILANGLHWVTASNKALWDKTGTSLLFTSTQQGYCGGHTMIEYPETSSRPRIEIETITLDEFLADHPRVDVMKIDAEGAEPRILDGMRGVVEASPGLKVLMEFSPRFVRSAGCDPEQFIDELEGMGFSIRLIQHDGRLAPFHIQEVLAGGDPDWLEMLFLEK